jgi:hypothetical protein
VSPDGKALYIAVKGLGFVPGANGGKRDDRLMVVDLAGGAAFDVTLDLGPDALALGPGYLLVTSVGSDRLDRVALPSYRVERVSVAAFPTGVTIAPP